MSGRTTRSPSNAEILEQIAIIRQHVVEVRRRFEAGEDGVSLVRLLERVRGELDRLNRALFAQHVASLLDGNGEFVGTRDQLLMLIREMRRL